MNCIRETTVASEDCLLFGHFWFHIFYPNSVLWVVRSKAFLSLTLQPSRRICAALSISSPFVPQERIELDMFPFMNKTVRSGLCDDLSHRNGPYLVSSPGMVWVISLGLEPLGRYAGHFGPEWGRSSHWAESNESNIFWGSCFIASEFCPLSKNCGPSPRTFWKERAFGPMKPRLISPSSLVTCLS